MLRLIYGGFGSGKSTRVNTLIRECIAKKDKYKKSIYLIVPEQDTVRAELEASEGLEPSSALCFEVQNFSRLADSVFRIHGGLSYNYANAQSKALCMWQTIRSLGGMIEEPMKEADEVRINSMLSVISELRTSGVELDKLERASEALGIDTPLGREVRDLSLIATVYERELDQKYSDSEKDLDRLCSILETKRFFAGCDIFIDGFSSFTAPQINVIERLLRDADSVTVTVPYDRTRGSYDYARETESTARKLVALATECGCECECEDMGGSIRGAYEDIRYVADNFYRKGAESIEGAEHFSFYVCADMREEAEAVASLIQRKVQEGARFRDIAVVARNAPDYAGILDAAFERHSIPCFFSSEVRAEAHPVVKLVYGVFTLYQKNCRREDVISYLKTGLCGISADDCDLFEKYVNAWKINGKRFVSDTPFINNPNGYKTGMNTREQYVLDRVNKVKAALSEQLVPLFSALGQESDIRTITAALWNYMESLDIASVLLREANALAERGDEQGARELEGTYRCLVDTLDTMVEVVGEEKVAPSEYFKLLKLCLRTKTVSVIPTSADAITVGSAHMLRTSGIKHVFVIGAADGIFPTPTADRGYFDDIKRNRLSAVGINITCDLETEVSKEKFYFARAVCSSSESVSVLYSVKNSTTSAAKVSTATTSLVRLITAGKPQRFSALGVRERVYDRAGLCEMAMTAERDACDGETRALLELAKESAVPRYKCADTISSEVTKEMYGTKINMSFSRFDKYVKCHFAHLCTYVLGLGETPDYSFGALDIGNFAHDILEHIMGELLEDGKIKEGITREEIDRRVSELTSEYLRKVMPEEDGRSARFLNLIKRIRSSVSLVCNNIRQELEQALFVPIGNEIEIKEGREDLPSPIEFKIREGVSLVFDGKIDRADTYRSGDDVFVRVIDYKTGEKTFSFDDVMAGVDLQMLIYLFTLCSQKGDYREKVMRVPEGGRILPAGMLYCSAMIKDMAESRIYAADEGLEMADKTIWRRGILTNNAEVLEAMDKGRGGRFIALKEGKTINTFFRGEDEFEELREHTERVICEKMNEMLDGRIDAEPYGNECQYCTMKAVCRRYDSDRMQRENEEEEV